LTDWPPDFSFHIHSAYVAKPSFSQMSCQRVTPTLSPNHWCASSCATIDSSAPNPPYTGRVWVSSAKFTAALSTVPPVESNG
jgi:hypothetical protein